MRNTLLGSGLIVCALIACSSPAPSPSPNPTPPTAQTSIVASPTPTGASPAPTLPTLPTETPAPIATTPAVTPTPTGTPYTPYTPAPQPGTTCSLQTNNPTCDTCANQFCCAQILACDANPDCVAIDNCFSQCMTLYGQQTAQEQQCENQCFQLHPQGGQLIDAIYACLDTSCVAQCPY